MAKHPKLEVAETAAYIDDMRQNQANQRDSIRRYEDMKVFGNDIPPRTQASGDEMGNFIVCDDYHVDNSTRPDPLPSTSNKLPIAIVAAAVAAWSLFGYSLLGDRDTQAPEPSNPPTVPASVEDTDTRYDLQFIE